MRYKAEHKVETRRRVLAEAARSIRTSGPDRVSVAEIMSGAGLTHGAFYAHFKSKDALWRAVIDQMFADLDGRMAVAARRSQGGTVRERLMSVVRAFIDLCAEDADIHRIMTIEGRQPTERLRWLVDQHLRDNHRAACALIGEGQALGVIRPGDPTLIYYSFIAIAGTAFSLAPEIRLVSGDQTAISPDAIEDLIAALLFVGA